MLGQFLLIISSRTCEYYLFFYGNLKYWLNLIFDHLLVVSNELFYYYNRRSLVFLWYIFLKYFSIKIHKQHLQSIVFFNSLFCSTNCIFKIYTIMFYIFWNLPKHIFLLFPKHIFSTIFIHAHSRRTLSVIFTGFLNKLCWFLFCL